MLQHTQSVLGLRRRYRDSLRAGMSGDRISVGKRLSTSWGLSILLHKEYWVIFGGKAARAWPSPLTPHLVPRLKKQQRCTPTNLCAFRAFSRMKIISRLATCRNSSDNYYCRRILSFHVQNANSFPSILSTVYVHFATHLKPLTLKNTHICLPKVKVSNDRMEYTGSFQGKRQFIERFSVSTFNVTFLTNSFSPC